MTPSSSLRALLRFQLHGGVRVALRTAAPVAGALAAAGVLAGDPLLPFAIAKELFFPFDSALVPGVLAVALFGASAAAAQSRLASGSAWLRHLPLAPRERVLGATAALWMSCFPWLALVELGGVLALLTGSGGRAHWRLLGYPVVVWIVAAAVARLRGWRRWAVALLGAPAASGSWWGVALAVGVSLWLGRLPAPRPARTPSRCWSGGARPIPLLAPTLELWLRMSFRAAGRQLMGAAFLPLLALIPVAFFILNNELRPRQELGALLFGGGVGIVLAVAAAAEALRRRRPVWPWLRTLPWSIRSRVTVDSLMLASLALPSLLSVAAADPRAGGLLLMLVPLAALRGAAAIRADEMMQGGAVTMYLLEGLCVAALAALLPLSSPAVAALAVLALPVAVRLGRRRPVGRWVELDHEEAGDPMGV